MVLIKETYSHKEISRQNDKGPKYMVQIKRLEGEVLIRSVVTKKICLEQRGPELKLKEFIDSYSALK